METTRCKAPTNAEAFNDRERAILSESFCRIGVTLIAVGGWTLCFALFYGHNVLPPFVNELAAFSSLPILVVGWVIAVGGLAIYASRRR